MTKKDRIILENELSDMFVEYGLNKCQSSCSAIDYIVGMIKRELNRQRRNKI